MQEGVFYVGKTAPGEIRNYRRQSQCRNLFIRVLDDENCAPVSRVVEAIYQAIDWKVNIINMSFGVSEYSAALEKAIQAAHKAGILVIAAAGNTGDAGVQYPAAFDEVMAVGSVDKHGDIVESSAKGGQVS